MKVMGKFAHIEMYNACPMKQMAKSSHMDNDPLGILLCELPASPTADECRDSLRLLPEWRRQKAEAFVRSTDQLQCAKAYGLLCQLLERRVGRPVAPRFGYGKHGKPFLPDWPQLHFNMSHCSRAVMCVVDDAPVGCDVEEIPSQVDDGVLSYCFSPEERELIMSASGPAVEFTRWWTRKEALLKMRGVGLVDWLPSLMSSPLAQGARFATEVRDGYVYTICRAHRPGAEAR